MNVALVRDCDLVCNIRKQQTVRRCGGHWYSGVYGVWQQVPHIKDKCVNRIPLADQHPSTGWPFKVYSSVSWYISWPSIVCHTLAFHIWQDYAANTLPQHVTWADIPPWIDKILGWCGIESETGPRFGVVHEDQVKDMEMERQTNDNHTYV